jgi:hypothetical protein
LVKDAKTAKGYIAAAGKFGALAEDAKAAIAVADKIIVGIEDFIKSKLPDLPPCRHGFYTPVPPLQPGGKTYAVTFSTDSTKVCTYDDGTGVPTPIAFADEEGNPISTDGIPVAGGIPFGEGLPPVRRTGTTEPLTPPAVVARTEIPSAPVPAVLPTERVPDTSPPARVETPPPPTPPVPETPPPPPVTETTPPPPTVTTVDAPPPPTADTPPPTDTIIFKVRQAVLEGTPTGPQTPGQTVKLLPTEKPGHPGTGQSKTVRDTGFDQPPLQCTTDANGDCRTEILSEEREVYRLPVLVGRPKQTYRVDVNVRQTTGAVVETTGRRTKPDLAGTPRGADLVGSEFKIGNRTFARIRSYVDDGANFSLRAKFDRPGSNYEEDFCRDKEPGPPLGTQPTSFSTINNGLPSATIKVDLTARPGRIRP